MMKKNILNTGLILILFSSVATLNSDTQDNIYNLNKDDNKDPTADKASNNESDDHNEVTLLEVIGGCANKASEFYNYIDNSIEKTITSPFLSQEKEYKLNDATDGIFKLFNIIEDEYEKFLRDISIAYYDDETFTKVQDWVDFEVKMYPFAINRQAITSSFEQAIGNALKFDAALNFNEMLDHINEIIKKHVGSGIAPVPRTKYTTDLAHCDVEMQKKKADMIQNISVLLYQTHISNNLIKLHIDMLKEAKKAIDHLEIEANAKGDQQKLDMHDFQVRFMQIHQAIRKDSMIIAKNYLILQKYNSILSQEDINNIFHNTFTMIDDNIVNSQALRNLDPTKIEKFFDVKKGQIKKDLHDTWWPIDVKANYKLGSKDNNNKLEHEGGLVLSTNLKKMKHCFWRHAKHGNSFILDEEHKAIHNFHDTYLRIIGQLNEAQKLNEEIILREKVYHENKRVFEGSLDDNYDYKRCATSYLEFMEKKAKLIEAKFELFRYSVKLLSQSSHIFDHTLPLEDQKIS